MKKANKKLLYLILILIIISGIFIYLNYKNKENEINTTRDINTNINTDDGDEDINWTALQEKNIPSNCTITEEGTYILTNTINDTITINTTDNVKLILDNVTIKPKNGPAILIKQAENTLIYLNENSKNTLEDTETYTYDDADINSVIYSKDDLIIDGTGTLTINSNFEDGITSKDDLKIKNGNFIINSKDDGIRGKDSVYIIDGNFNIISNGDAIKSTNNTDEEKGFILIENGKFKLESELDGLQAETKLVIKNGTFDIKTGGGSTNSSNTSNNWGFWGPPDMKNNTEEDNASAKGIKAKDNIVIENGKFTLDTSDDAIHSNNYIGITNGTFNISSGDDGIHADTQIIIDEGTINIEKSYEGIEAQIVTINDGTINIIASDDGINIAGGNDSSSMNRPGENNFSSNNNNKLIINNGTIFVNSVGDGIDVNGSAYIYNGNIIVEGPTDSGNGTLDYDKEFIVDGGTIIATGSSGMLQSISSNKQYNITISLSNYYENSSTIILKDSNNNEIISSTPSKSFSSIIISSPLLKEKETYTLTINDKTITTFKLNEISTTIGTSNNTNPGNIPNNKKDPRR